MLRTFTLIAFFLGSTATIFAQDNPFITTWETGGSTSITIPTTGDNYNYTIKWQEEGTSATMDSTVSIKENHTISDLKENTVYRVEISGDFPRIYFNNGGDKGKLLRVESWGDIAWSSMEGAFSGCSNLTIPASDAPDLSRVTNMSYMFQGATSFNQDLSDWDVSHVTSMGSMFQGATSFNQDLGGWDVGSVKDMSAMFWSATNFDQDLSGWNVSRVTTMSYMFGYARNFDQDLSGWNVSRVTGMNYMFSDATNFNQNLGGWDVSGVGDMESMLDHSGLSNVNYNNTLIGWSKRSVKQGVALGASGLVYFCDAVTARALLTETKDWTITGDQEEVCRLFITRWNTGGSTTITIPTTGDNYNYTIKWQEEGTSATMDTVGIQENYTISDLKENTVYRVEISGDFPRIYFNNGGDKGKLLRVESWGDIAWSSMEGAFYGCSNLTIPASDAPDLSRVTNMGSMFSGATNFNQDLSGWNVSHVTDMSSMFLGATSFNQDLGGWEVDSVTNMGSMFSGATSFNQDLGGWEVDSVTNMGSMFRSATNFNQDLSGWSVSHVTNMRAMFFGATNFNQDLSGWNVSGVTDMTNMLDNSGLSNVNYTTTLIGWSEQEVQTGITLGAAGLVYFCNAVAAHALLRETKGWTITEDRGCLPFITRWQTDNTGTSTDTEITIPTMGTGYNYNVYWKEVDNPDNNSNNPDNATATGSVDLTGLTDSITINFGASGTYRVEITGDFPRIYFNNDGDKDKLLSIDQWGGIVWSSMEDAFYGCSKLTTPATGVPDLSRVRSMKAMFSGATSFNQDLGSWKVDSVTNMGSMFSGATSFNQDLGSWKVDSVTNMGSMFSGATSFNQDLSGWDVSGVGNMTNMLDHSGLSTVNYTTTLIGWSEQEVQTGITLGAAGLVYSCDAVAARTLLEAPPNNWTITDDRGCLPFITRWNTGGSTSITIPTTGTGYNYNVYWEEVDNLDNNSNNPGNATATRFVDLTGLTDNITINFGASGTYSIEITGDFPRIYFNDGGDKDKLLRVDQWGDIAWRSMEKSFSGCSNLTVPALDAPDLSRVTSMRSMFNGARSLNQDISDWDVSRVGNMTNMFSYATNFDQDLSDWNVSRVTDMGYMFTNATNFDQDLSDWNVSRVTNMSNMFHTARNFNQDISGWDVSRVTDMSLMFETAGNFDQDLSGWNVSRVTNMSNMFRNAISFNQDLGGWNVSKVGDMGGMLTHSGLSNINYNNTLIGWSRQDVQQGVALGASDLVYSCVAVDARALLTETKGWTIRGDREEPCRPFITTWNTGGSTSITIPTTGDNYNYTIKWQEEEGTSATMDFTVGIQENYTISDLKENTVYRIEISGDFPRIYFNNGGDKGKLLTVENWGNITWSSMEGAFYGCSNLTIPASGAPDLSRVTNMSSMFLGATSFDQDLSGWNVSHVTDMDSMFAGAIAFDQSLDAWNVSHVTNMRAMFFGATNFNQDLSGWNVSGVTDMTNMLDNSGLSTVNYTTTLIGWSEQEVQTGITLGAAGLVYFCDAVAAHALLRETKGWTITEDRGCLPFITRWQTDNTGTSTDTEITIPTMGTGYNYNVYWKEVDNPDNNSNNPDNATATGSVDLTGLTDSITINFGASGTYRVEITGDFPRIYFNNDGDKDKLLSIDQWGGIVWSSMEDAFYGCSKLTTPATDVPYLSRVRSMKAMFSGATNFNQDIGSWNVSHVTDMSSMFLGATSFNQDLGGWEVDSVTNMGSMFNGATSFNQDLGGWDVSGVGNMTNMLDHSGLSNVNYNNTLIGWSEQEVQTGITLGAAGLVYFCNAVAARALLMEETKGWTITGDQEEVCRPFITTWNTGGSTSITIPITGDNYTYTIKWQEEEGTSATMDSTVVGIPENYTISDLKENTVYRVEITGNFPRIYFNNVGDKDKLLTVKQWGGITWSSMEGAFYGCSKLIIPASDAPDLSRVTNMKAMFKGATTFNQPLKSWDVGAVTDMDNMLDNTALSIENYDNLLIGWSKRSVKQGVTLGAAGLVYSCEAVAAHELLTTAPNNWKIKEDELSCTAVVGLLLVKTPDSKEELQLTVYPNPFSDTGISIALLGANEEETVTISIVDVLGRVQYTSRKQVDDQGELNLTLSDLGQWNTGLYIIQVFTEKGAIKTSTIKQK